MCNLCVLLFQSKCRSTKKKEKSQHTGIRCRHAKRTGAQNEPEHKTNRSTTCRRYDIGSTQKPSDVEKYPAINVLSIFAGFRSRKVKFGITPLRFQLPDGQSHRIAQVRQSHTERVGQAVHYHFVVRSTEQRYFHIVFDAGKLTWHLVQEFDAELLFNE